MDKTKTRSALGNLTLSQFYIGTKVAFGCELISYFRLILTLAPRQKYCPLCLRSHAGSLLLLCCSNLASSWSDSKLLGGGVNLKLSQTLTALTSLNRHLCVSAHVEKRVTV